MGPQAVSKTAKSSQLSPRILSKHLDFVAKYVRARSAQRRETQERNARRNVKVATAMARSFSKAGIDTSQIDAVCLANAAEAEREMKKYRQQRKLVPPKPLPLPRGLTSSNRIGAAPFNPNNFFRTPPFDIADAWLSPVPTGSFAFANSAPSGSMNFFMVTPINAVAPGNISADAVMGIIFPPFGLAFPTLGLISASMTGTLTMTAHAACSFLGYGHSDGGVGWIVLELNSLGEITRQVELLWNDKYYIDVNFGQSTSANLPTAEFSSSTSFVTLPGMNYEIYVWLEGNIQASGSQGLWASMAAGFGSLSVSTISGSWSPFIFPF
jgi:hypothetical protein